MHEIARTPVASFALALALALPLGLLACSDPPAAPAVATIDRRLVGIWETDATSSSLGKSVTNYKFKPDGAFHAVVTFVKSTTPPVAAHGTWGVVGNVLTTQVGGRVVNATWEFDRDALVLRQGDAVLRFHRK